MDGLQRAVRDILAGELGLARQRLESYVTTRGYHPDIMGRLGQVCFDMKDRFNAGRHWMLSSAQGQDVDDAIEFFMRSTGRIPEQAINSFSRRARLPGAELYPPVVQERLRRYQLDSKIARVYEFRNPPKRMAIRSAFGKKVVKWLILSFVLFGLTSCVVGARTILKWAFS